VQQQLVAAIIGLVVGAAGAWVKAALAIRAKVNEELRDRRLEVYPPVYRETATLSTWPPADLTYQQLFGLNVWLRGWYFACGGLYLSENSRKRYGHLQELLCLRLDQVAEGGRDEDVASEIYQGLAATGSAFRTALTEDLETRRQRSLWWVVAQRKVHRKHDREWDARRSEAGPEEHEFRSYPLAEMPVPPLDEPPGGSARQHAS
jgi:hypothetical protein